MTLYFLAILPPEPLLSELSLLKKEVSERFDTIHSLKSPPHITLLRPFPASEVREARLKEQLQKLAGEFHSFSLRLSGFGHFGNRVVFIQPEFHPDLLALHSKSIKLFQEELPVKLRQEVQSNPFHPHLTLAHRDLSPEQFELCWHWLNKKEYKSDFLVTSVALFKHNGKVWEVLKGAEFRQ